MNMFISVFEKFTVHNGYFHWRAKKFAKFLIVGTILMIGLDLLLAGIAYGKLGFQDKSFYIASLAMITILALVTRKNAETSFTEMKKSKNILVRLISWLILLAMAIIYPFAWIVAKGAINNNRSEDKTVDYAGSFGSSLYDYSNGYSGSAPDGFIGVHPSRVKDC